MGAEQAPRQAPGVRPPRECPPPREGILASGGPPLDRLLHARAAAEPAAGKTELTWYFTMDPAGAALAASWVKPRTVIPMHDRTFPLLTGTPKELEAALHGRAKVLVPEAGKPIAL